jgi:hypothetical protein
MIQLACPNCHAKLQAKAHLAGQVRKCPKCSHPVRIIVDGVSDSDAAAPPAVDEASPVEQIQRPAEDRLPTRRPLERLTRESHYLICDKTHVVAAWENNGNGWMIKSGSGFVSARRNKDKLPTQGDFQLVELKFALTTEGKRLSGLAVHQLVSRWALTSLDQGDDEIVEKITAPGRLNRDQKAAVRLTLRELFMRPVWEHAADVLDYLANTDYHSPGVG